MCPLVSLPLWWEEQISLFQWFPEDDRNMGLTRSFQPGTKTNWAHPRSSKSQTIHRYRKKTNDGYLMPWSCIIQWSEVAQSWPTLCDPIDCNLPGSSVHGIFQAIVLEWIAIPFSRGSSQPRDWTTSPSLQADSLPLSHQGSPQCQVDVFSFLTSMS